MTAPNIIFIEPGIVSVTADYDDPRRCALRSSTRKASQACGRCSMSPTRST